PLEERRSHAVQARRTIDSSSAGDICALDQDAIDRVREQERPDPRDADELHDALLTAGFLMTTELEAVSPELLAELSAQRRAGSVRMDPSSTDAAHVVIGVERLTELRAIHPNLATPPSLQPPASRLAKTWTREEAIAEIVRGRLTLAGPIPSAALPDHPPLPP